MDQVIKIMFIIWNRERYKIRIRLSRRVYGFMNIWTYLSEYTTVGLVVRIYVTFLQKNDSENNNNLISERCWR